MAKKKEIKKKATGVVLECACGASSQVIELKKGFMAHCAACGTLIFFNNPQLLERVNYGGKLCPHQPESKPCPGGSTTWCPTCRVRTFYYQG